MQEVRNFRRRQLSVFEAILRRCADAGNKVLTVHSRRASAQVIDAVGLSYPGVVILHWFSGPLKDLERAAATGMYFSVNPAMGRSANGRKLVVAMPRDRVLTETDGPFVQVAGRPAVPQDTAEVLTLLGELWECTPSEAETRVAENLVRAVGSF
jgi:TatD DNase family protein